MRGFEKIILIFEISTIQFIKCKFDVNVNVKKNKFLPDFGIIGLKSVKTNRVFKYVKM